MSRHDSALTRFAGITSFRAVSRSRGADRARGPHKTADELESLQSFLLFAPILLFSVIAHEYAHGYAALKQGDATALMLGRLSWNPIKHIDPFMTVILPTVLW